MSFPQTGTLLDPYHPLTPAQRDVQRQNTVQLLQRSVQIPENETEIQETLNLIQELNTLQFVLVQPEEQEQGSVVSLSKEEQQRDRRTKMVKRGVFERVKLQVLNILP